MTDENLGAYFKKQWNEFKAQDNEEARELVSMFRPYIHVELMSDDFYACHTKIFKQLH